MRPRIPLLLLAGLAILAATWMWAPSIGEPSGRELEVLHAPSPPEAAALGAAASTSRENAAAPGAGPAELRRDVTPFLRGRVVDERGRPVAHARIRVLEVAEDPLRRSKILADLHSEPDGSFAIPCPEEPVVNLLARKPDVGIGEGLRIERANTAQELPDRVLREFGVVEGQVVDRAGRPVSGIPLQLKHWAPEGNFEVTFRRPGSLAAQGSRRTPRFLEESGLRFGYLETGENGRFRAAGLAEGQWHIEVLVEESGKPRRVAKTGDSGVRIELEALVLDVLLSGAGEAPWKEGLLAIRHWTGRDAARAFERWNRGDLHVSRAPSGEHLSHRPIPGPGRHRVLVRPGGFVMLHASAPGRLPAEWGAKIPTGRARMEASLQLDAVRERASIVVHLEGPEQAVPTALFLELRSRRGGVRIHEAEGRRSSEPRRFTFVDLPPGRWIAEFHPNSPDPMRSWVEPWSAEVELAAGRAATLPTRRPMGGRVRLAFPGERIRDLRDYELRVEGPAGERVFTAEQLLTWTGKRWVQAAHRNFEGPSVLLTPVLPSAVYEVQLRHVYWSSDPIRAVVPRGRVGKVEIPAK